MGYNFPLPADVYYKEWRYKSPMIYNAGIDHAERQDETIHRSPDSYEDIVIDRPLGLWPFNPWY
jgi:hypothetical protein